MSLSTICDISAANSQILYDLNLEIAYEINAAVNSFASLASPKAVLVLRAAISPNSDNSSRALRTARGRGRRV